MDVFAEVRSSSGGRCRMTRVGAMPSLYLLTPLTDAACGPWLLRLETFRKAWGLLVAWIRGRRRSLTLHRNCGGRDERWTRVNGSSLARKRMLVAR